MYRCLTLIATLALLWAPHVRTSVAQAPTINLVPAFSQLSFDSPVVLTHAADGSGTLYVVEQGGTIRSFENSDQADDTELYLDIRDRVLAGGELGLLGLAFHPQYEANGRLFVYYSASTDGGTVTRLSRFERDGVSGSTADPSSETVLFEVVQTASNHNAGDLAFGHDGMLYASIGDGGAVPGDAQDRSNLLGTIVRIDVDEDPDAAGQPPYGIPDDNPFVGNEEGIRDEIFAYGLRNPWRFSIDAETGRIWTGDVGQNDWEEVDIIESGGNYGWPVMEGFECYQAPGCDASPYVLPVHTYENGVQGRSITGGYVYRGPGASSLVGAYVFGDFLSGRIWRLDELGGRYQATEIEILPNLLISAFGVDEERNLYVLDYGGGGIFRFEEVLAHSSEDPADLISETRFGLSGPNPFRTRTELTIHVENPGPVMLQLFSADGRLVRTVFEGYVTPASSRNVDIDAAGLTPGVYFARLTTASSALTTSLVVAK